MYYFLYKTKVCFSKLLVRTVIDMSPYYHLIFDLSREWLVET